MTTPTTGDREATPDAAPAAAPPVDDWRGVASEGAEQVSANLAGFLRGRSRRLLWSLLRPQRHSITRAALAIVGYTACTLAGPYLVKLAIDRGIPPLLDSGSGSPVVLAVLVAAFLVVSFSQGFLDHAYTVHVGRLGQDVLLDLRRRLFTHLQSLSMSFHERYTSGRVISRLTSDVEALSDLLIDGIQTLVWATLLLVSITVVLLLVDVPMALVALAIVPFVIAATLAFRRHSERAYRSRTEAVALVIVQFVESLRGIRAVQAFRREPRNQAIFEDVNGRLRNANVWSGRLSAWYGPGIRGLGHAATAAVLVVGGYRVVHGQTTVGDLAAILLYLRRFFEPIQELSQFYNLFQAAAAALEKLSGVLDESPSVPEPATPVPLPEARGEVRLEDVRFAYRPDGRPVRPHLDLTIPAGQTVALVGATGAGKTTVARLIARFYDPAAGRVLLDGVDLRDLTIEDLRRAVVTVTQESFLFAGTIADNIAVGRPTASREEIEAAAEAIGAHAFISALPEGYDTDVRTRGGRLSAGQRQLVSFARAFLADPRVLILDEATSSLDIPTERLVQRALRTLLADRTALIIAHRLTTVEIADRVLVVEGGRLVEDGSPAELLRDGGRYARLHRAWAESLL